MDTLNELVSKMSPEQRSTLEAFARVLLESPDDDDDGERTARLRERAFEEAQLSAAGMPLEAARQSRCP